MTNPTFISPASHTPPPGPSLASSAGNYGIGPAPSLTELTRTGLKIGLLSFGGPAGQIALMHRVFVDEKRWIDEERYLHGLNYCMLLPGPEAQQLATYVGWRLHGAAGGIVTGLSFVLPGALIVLALSYVYAAFGQTVAVEAAFYGVKAAVIAFIAEALWKIRKRAVKGWIDLFIAAAAFAALFVFAAPFPVVILGAAAIGALMFAGGRKAGVPVASVTEAAEAPVLNARLLRTIATWLAIWLAPLVAAFAALGPDHPLVRVGALFSKLAVVTFGGAYAVLAYLQQQAVDAEGWLTAAQMIDGLGLAETTPGPLILVNQFVGFMAGWQADGGGAGLALAAAIMATWCTFAPSFLWIFAGAPFAEKLRRNERAAGALRAVTAAVLGVVASVGAAFALAVLFERSAPATTPWGSAIVIPDLASFDAAAALISLLAAVALMRFKAGPAAVVVASMLAGAAVFQLRTIV